MQGSAAGFTLGYKCFNYSKGHVTSKGSVTIVDLAAQPRVVWVWMWMGIDWVWICDGYG